MTAFHDLVKAAGFRVGVYGSGQTCRTLKTAGYCEFTWLAQSTGWSGYEDWEPHADIVQGPPTTLMGLGADSDTIRNLDCVR
jgi:hypothetical protein